MLYASYKFSRWPCFALLPPPTVAPPLIFAAIAQALPGGRLGPTCSVPIVAAVALDPSHDDTSESAVATRAHSPILHRGRRLLWKHGLPVLQEPSRWWADSTMLLLIFRRLNRPLHAKVETLHDPTSKRALDYFPLHLSHRDAIALPLCTMPL